MRTKRKAIAIINRNHLLIRLPPSLPRMKFSEATGANDGHPLLTTIARKESRLPELAAGRCRGRDPYHTYGPAPVPGPIARRGADLRAWGLG
jgi:hypothetical protein